jgi:hypothetical protein
MAVIALWLGHESLETTHVYVEADLAIKERALEKRAPTPSGPPATAPTTNSWRSWPDFDYATLITTKRGVLLRQGAPARHNPDRGMNVCRSRHKHVSRT